MLAMQHLKRIAVSVLASLLLLCGSTHAETEDDAFDWGQWENLAVQGGGRQKPLGTLAWETLRLIGNRSKFEDPQTGERLSPTALYLAMIFDWQSGDERPKDDKWDRADLLRIDYVPLREALDLPLRKKHVSPSTVFQAKILDPDTGRRRPFLDWGQQVSRDQERGHSRFDDRAVRLANKYAAYASHRTGLYLEILPLGDDEEGQWVSMGTLLRTELDDRLDPSGEVRAMMKHFEDARAAYKAGSAKDFNQASGAFIADVRKLGPEMGEYPPQEVIDLEVTYYHQAPFLWSWILMGLAFILVLISLGSKWKAFYAASLGAYCGGLAAMIVGFWMRTEISGRAPVTNMYESVIYLGLGTALFGLAFEIFHRKQYILAAASGVATLALLLADNCPTVLDPSLQPLVPVLRSNVWLIAHVMSITLGYAAFALALGISDITLGYYIVGSKNQDAINGLSRFNYRALQAGVLLFTAGTILGGVWADYAWGRFWGWDPKEVWSLVVLLAYVAVLHARHVGWLGNFGLAAWSVISFATVVFAWYGVNYILGAGLHSYGFGGGGGRNYVFAVVVCQLIYVLFAWFIALMRPLENNQSGKNEPHADQRSGKDG